MPNSSINVLITRPEYQGQLLANTLEKAGYRCICQPFFSYQDNANSDTIKTVIASCRDPIVIFVSTAAVEFAAKKRLLSDWHFSAVIAVGNATKQALQAHNINDVICPAKQDSDGVLSLIELQDVLAKDIVIVRGDGGRELIADSLKARGAKVQYIESYQKHWLTLSSTQVIKWQDEKVNCVIITSNAILESVVELLNSDDNIATNYWFNSCLWIVVSARLVEKAHEFGLKNVICADGASDAALLAAISDREKIHDRKKISK